MITETFPAMGTTVVVTTDAPNGVAQVQALFATVEDTCSRFRPDSELCRLNRSSAGAQTISPLLADALGTALEMRRRTDGLCDPTLGREVQAWGYDRSFAAVTDRETAPALEPRPGAAVVVRGCTVRRPAGVELDLGGTAKGWAVDRAIEAGMARVVNAGGDLRSTDPRTEVDVDDPWGRTPAVVRLGVGSLATSSTAFRRWRVAGEEVSHLLDPRTGAPVHSPVVQATALAATAVEAEAAAKAILLQGAHGLAWARRTSWVRGALVIWHDGAVFATAELAQVLV